MSIHEIITKDRAKANGLKYYFTGKPCKHGHIAERSTNGSNCKVCHQQRTEQRTKEFLSIPGNRENINSKHRQTYRDNIKHNMVLGCQRRAKAKNLTCSITVDDISLPSHCPVLGIPLLIGQEHCRDNWPSIDRIIPSQGYIPGNIVIVSSRANRIKNDSTVEELGKLYEFYKELQNNKN
jgi:hypothetical protein